MKSKKIDNFSKWRSEMRALDKNKSKFLQLERNGDLAELLGAVLGDGNIYKHARTEALRIVSNSNNQGFVDRYVEIIYNVFGKRPSALKRKYSNAVNITIYENNISERLGIPTGAKRHLDYVIPDWIMVDESYKKRFLRGLFETDGSSSIHLRTSTYKFSFSNKNESLLNTVYNLLVSLGFHPSIGCDRVQISRKEEVRKAINLLEFRNYAG